MKIIVFIDWFLPGYKAGGPIKSVKNILSFLSSECNFWVVTGDRDLGDTQPYQNIPLNEWIQCNDYHIIYLSPDKQSKANYKQLIDEIKPDKIYFNSLFSFRFTILPMLIARFNQTIPIIIAPRGMLGTGALQINKTKKRLFLLLCKWSGFFKNVIWQASSENEENEIKENIGNNAKVKIAMNLSETSSDTWMPKAKEKGSVNLFFVSRISKKKNVLFALECLSKIKTASIDYYVIGTNEEPKYWEQCQTIISQLPNRIKIHEIGAVENNRLPDIVKNYHFLFLPTLHENFGHVIVESFQAGCPVIISNQTPWRDLEEKNIGWDIPLTDKKKFVQIIEQCAEMGQEDYNNMSKNTYEFAQKIINNPEIIEQNRKLFQD